jgi:hypothetical protein
VIRFHDAAGSNLAVVAEMGEMLATQKWEKPAITSGKMTSCL